MDRFPQLNIALGIGTLLVCIVLVRGQADDFPGPYCATRPGGCCTGRKDACAVPISSKFFSLDFMHNLCNMCWMAKFGFSRKKFNAELQSLTNVATLCYCDDFCGSFINGDCCPDYASFCLGVPDPLTEKCNHNGQWFERYQQTRDNCNLW